MVLPHISRACALRCVLVIDCGDVLAEIVYGVKWPDEPTRTVALITLER